MTSTLAKDTLATQLYNDLLAQIVLGKLTIGSRINARRLQQVFNTSATPVREALGRLVSEGLVEYETNLGYRVVRFSQRDVREINDILALTDCHAIELAMKSPSIDRLISELKTTVDNQQAAYDRGDEALYRKSTEYFHDVFYLYADNHQLTALSRKYNYRMKLMAGLYESHENRRISLREHALIYHAVKDRDADTAMRYMRQHIFETCDALIDQYRTLFSEDSN